MQEWLNIQTQMMMVISDDAGVADDGRNPYKLLILVQHTRTTR